MARGKGAGAGRRWAEEVENGDIWINVNNKNKVKDK